MGADIMSNSWGGGPYEQALYDAIAETDALFVAAAGNWGENTDVSPNYPSCYDLPNVLAVGATDHNDRRADWSNWGPQTVDVFAPGQDILSTVLGTPPVFTPDILDLESVSTCDDLAAWDVSDFTIDPWSLSSTYFTSDPASIARIGYGNKEEAWAKLVDPVDLSSRSSALLRFRAFYETEPGFDELHAWVSHDGIDWVEIATFSGWSDGFRQVDCDISGYVGDADVYIAFSFTSDASVNSKDGYTGVAIDDIEIVEMDPVFVEDFSDLDEWDASEYAQQPWALTTERYVSAPSAVGNLSYFDNESAWLKLVSPIDMSGVSGDIALTAQVFYMTEAGVDAMVAWASTDGFNWRPLARFSGFSGMWDASFVPVTLDLSSYAGSPEVYLAFSLTSNGALSGADGLQGVAIDDVAVLRGEWTESDYTSAYDLFSGTSMATPHVAGIAALVLSEWPDSTSGTLKYAVMQGADPLPQLAGRCVTGARANAYRSIQDLYPPVVTDDNTGAYTAVAEITLSATDDSGVRSISYHFDNDPPTTVLGDRAVARTTIPAKRHTLTYWAEDMVGNVSQPVTVQFTLTRGTVSSQSVAGRDRYVTAVEASRRAFPGGAATVVLATGRNWPDAVAGSALAGVVDGPLLLTDQAAAPSVVLNEIRRLGATSVIVLGGERSVSSQVVSSLRGIVGAGGVTRIAGADRYQTAALIAAEVIARHPSYDGKAFVASGANYPDALAAAPIATHRGWPVLLADPRGDVSVPDEVTSVVVLGGEASVSSGVGTGASPSSPSASPSAFGSTSGPA
jgi:subtilisin family serine protease